MLQAGTELPATAALPTASLWLPGKKADAGGTSARAQEIARRRDELYGMLKDLPESEYELSLTDLVEKATGGGGSGAPTGTKESSPASRSASGRQMEPAGKERKSSRTRRDGVSSFRSRSDGVLLNFYMPASLKRSSTAPRPGRPPGAAGGSARFSADCNKRERESDSVKCWPSLWDRPWRKSSRKGSQVPPGEPTIRTTASDAILKAADHSTAPSKF